MNSGSLFDSWAPQACVGATSPVRVAGLSESCCIGLSCWGNEGHKKRLPEFGSLMEHAETSVTHVHASACSSRMMSGSCGNTWRSGECVSWRSPNMTLHSCPRNDWQRSGATRYGSSSDLQGWL